MKRASLVVSAALSMAMQAITKEEPRFRVSSQNDYEPPQFKRPDRKQWRGKKGKRK